MNAPLLTQGQRELHPIPPPEEPWTHCGIDLVYDLPTNSKGFRHILVNCYLTKYVAARALLNKTTREVLDKLQDIYLTYGVPKVILHNQAPNSQARYTQLFFSNYRGSLAHYVLESNKFYKHKYRQPSQFASLSFAVSTNRGIFCVSLP